MSEAAAFYVWHAHLQQPVIAATFERHQLNLHQILVWVKPVATFGHSYYRWRHEPCAFGWRRGHKPKHGYGNMDSVWEVDWEGKARITTFHPTSKPTRLFEIPMEQHTRKGAVVLEPFSGSGSQIIAAEKLGRRCRAMEISPVFVDGSVRRWEKATGKQATLDGIRQDFPRGRGRARRPGRGEGAVSPFYWLVAIAALIAVWLNIRRHVACFWIWAGTNAVWTHADWTHGLHAQAALQAVYFVFSLYGIHAWSRERKVSTMRKIPADAFEFYAALGPARSYQAVAEKYAVSKRSVTKFALKEKWQERLQTIEVKAREASDQKAQETLEAIRTRHLKGMRFIQAKAIETLKSASLDTAADAVRAYTAAVREERVMLGEPADRTAVSVEDTIRREYTRWLTPGETEEGEDDAP